MNALIQLLVLVTLQAKAPAFDPTSSYKSSNIEGWKVLFSGHISEAQSREARRLMQYQLYQVERLVPADKLAKLREVSIWVEEGDKDHHGACYHPDKGWLIEHDYNPDKEKCVEISNVDDFLSWTHEQPYMVLHELAHSFHDRVLGFDNPDVKALFDKAKASGNYDSVLHYNGAKVKHYAMNNPQEYFAESSEAFFGTNDFYPFVRAELKEQDPDMYAYLCKVWGIT